MGLCRVVHGHGGPLCDTVLVVEEGGGVDRLELLPDPTPLDHLLNPGGDDVVLELHAFTLRKSVHPAEPTFHSGEEVDVLPMLLERLSGQLHAILHPGLADHEEHVAEDRIGILGHRQIHGHLPELFRLNPELRNVSVLLHVPGTQCPVEVVADGYRLHFRNWFKTLRSKPPK